MKKKTPAQRLLLLGLIAFLLAGTATLAQAAPSRADAANGEAVFSARCAACHTIGKGKLVGPDLLGITTRRDTAWLTAWIKEPEKVLAAGDPIATQLLAEYNNIPMSNQGLSDAEVADLLAYFTSVDSPPADPAQTVAPLPEPLTGAAKILALNGDSDYGEKLFTGEAPLLNGGTPCMACHSIEGVGLIGGGTLGPDQTHLYTKYGREGLAATLGTLPFPTMQGIFAAQPLTISEQADLLAFFARADKQGQPRTPLNLALALGAGSAFSLACLLGMFFFWPRQRMSLAQRLRKNGKL